MKIVIYTLVPIIIVNLIYGRGFLPYNIFIIIVCIITVIGAYYLWTNLASIIMRDNMNYNKFNWAVPPPDDGKKEGRVDDPWFTGNMPGIICVGSYCCSDGLVYDETNDVCVVDTKKKGKDNKKLDWSFLQ
jgi:hypothetical protein